MSLIEGLHYYPFEVTGIQELPPAREKLFIKLGGITISGRSGTGKTTVVEKLAALYGIPQERIHTTGRGFRKRIGESIGFMERDIQVDEQIDQMQRDLIETADPANPFILEGRLAGFIASKARQEARQRGESLPVISVLFVAKKQTRERRAFEQARAKNPALTLKEFRKASRLRAKLDLERWQKVHPELAGKDPFDKDLKDANGKRVYDLSLSTTNLPPDQVISEIHKWLVNNGYVRKQETILEAS